MLCYDGITDMEEFVKSVRGGFEEAKDEEVAGMGVVGYPVQC